MSYSYKSKQEKLRQSLLKEIEEESRIISKVNKEKTKDRVNQRKDFVRRLQFERREASLNGVVLKAQELANLQSNQVVQEEKLAAELDLIRRKEIVDEKLRLHLRENSHELKELETNLKLAYANKILAAQLAEKEANKLEEQLRERKAREILECAMGSDIYLEEQKRKAEKEKLEFRMSLQNQIIEKERLRQQEYLSFLNEKKMSEDILEKIREDEVRELQEKKCMQMKLKHEMEQFNIAREMWKAKERLMIQQEEEKIKQIEEEKARQETQKKIEKNDNQARADALHKQIVEQSKERKKLMDKRLELVAFLIRNDLEEKENKKKQEEFEKNLALKRQAIADYQNLQAEKARKKLEEREMDKKIAEQMKLKLEEEERIEREKQEKRRQNQINNRKYNEEAMKKNVQKRAEGLKLTQLINELKEKEEKRKAEMIQQERIRMLREHAPKLLGYFPKGCLKKGDLEVLGLTEKGPLQESCPLEENYNKI